MKPLLRIVRQTMGKANWTCYFYTYVEEYVMPKGSHLGELEQLVLLATARLRGEGYGVTIRQELLRRVERRVPVAAVYGTLERLAAKGYLATRMGEATPERGGRAKRYYRLTPAGARALRQSRAMLDRMWEDLDLGTVPR